MCSQYSPDFSVESLPDSDMDTTFSSPVVNGMSVRSTSESSEVSCAAADATKNASDSALRRHEKYFMSDGNITFIVENDMYCVHRYFLQQHSPWFRDLFERYGIAPSDAKFAGQDPILLAGIRSLDFARFLSVLYPSKFGMHDVSTVDEWTSILELSAQWNFVDIISLATKELARIVSPVEKVVLIRKYHVHIAAAWPAIVKGCEGLFGAERCDMEEWLGGAYHAIFTRDEDLTLEEGERLGMAEVIKIAHARRAMRVSMTFVDEETKEKIIEEAIGCDERVVAPDAPVVTAEAPVATPNVTADASAAPVPPVLGSGGPPVTPHAVPCSVSGGHDRRPTKARLSSSWLAEFARDTPSQYCEETNDCSEGGETGKKGSKAKKKDDERRERNELGKMKEGKGRKKRKGLARELTSRI
ncbi:hypothetical protein PLICRDRAFT_219429 [Plicaturopsis crispa FD-325 SS-3]|nr:hypothetical protein PLICRDRAFT_219429 [Plicaturopsis crispa FD-325 SS-3]